MVPRARNAVTLASPMELTRIRVSVRIGAKLCGAVMVGASMLNASQFDA